MVKKRIIKVSLIIAAILSIFLVYRFGQYILVWEANPRINVDGIKLMMTEDEVKGILGKEEEYIPGFGGYILKYPKRGISLVFLDDKDTDFYNKVDKIEITDAKYEIYNIRVGDDYENALNTICRHGYTKQKEGFSGYWKYNMYIMIEKNVNKVGSITIGINDRVSSKRVY